MVQDFYNSNSIIVIISFCFLHFISAMLSVPGSCTFLNIFGGAVFGFFPAILIIYPITLFSGVVGYFLGKKIPSDRFPEKFTFIVEKIKKYLLKNDFLNLVILRLSPFFPYGVLNVTLGIMKIDFKTFFLTTLVGIFFDVVLLSSIGAFLFKNGDSSKLDHTLVSISFFSLFILVYFVKIIVDRQIQRANHRREF